MSRQANFHGSAPRLPAALALRLLPSPQSLHIDTPVVAVMGVVGSSARRSALCDVQFMVDSAIVGLNSVTNRSKISIAVAIFNKDPFIMWRSMGLLLVRGNGDPFLVFSPSAKRGFWNRMACDVTPPEQPILVT